MTRYMWILVGALFTFTLIGCGGSTTWTKEQIEAAKKHCNENLDQYAKTGLDKLDVKSFCDCTVKKMSQEYSYEMSQELIPTERMELASECADNW